MLEIPHSWVVIDILSGDTRTTEFVAMNPDGKIPVLELAKVQQWQFFEQYSHEPFIAVALFIAKFLDLPDERRDEYESKQEGGHKALSIMEEQLSHEEYLVGSRLSTADISLYAYTHVADEGGFDLTGYPAIQRWLARIENHPNYTGMT